YRATQDRARQVLSDAQRKRWGEPPFGTLGSLRHVQTGVESDEAKAVRAEGLNPDIPRSSRR
ncbi:MAG: hypothetical protein WA231_14080, partial [Methylocella sp.]